MDGQVDFIFKNISSKKMGDHFTEDEAMALAISVAKKGAPYVSPNPLVGCVVLDQDNKLITTGYHTQYGKPHAEAEAIINLNKLNLSEQEIHQLQFFVTLEPCAHQGKTPSCAKALAQLKPAKVVYGLVDPNPLVAGQGAEILKDVGIETYEYQGLLKNNLELLAEVFLKNFRQKKIFVAAKVAQSLDGQIALKSGESKWITSDASREFVHELRSWYDAILVGANTVLIDNPSLNIRHPEISKDNKVIVLDTSARVLEKLIQNVEFNFFKTHKDEDIFLCVSKEKLTVFKDQISESEILNKIKIIEFENLDQLLDVLWGQQIRSIFIEGGAFTYSAFLQNNLIDRMYVFVAPAIIGSGNGLSWTQNFSIDQLAKKQIMKFIEISQFGSDLFLTGRLNI